MSGFQRADAGPVLCLWKCDLFRCFSQSAVRKSPGSLWGERPPVENRESHFSHGQIKSDHCNTVVEFPVFLCGVALGWRRQFRFHITVIIVWKNGFYIQRILKSLLACLLIVLTGEDLTLMSAYCVCCWSVKHKVQNKIIIHGSSVALFKYWRKKISLPLLSDRLNINIFLFLYRTW